MEESYDVIVLGTGLKECILSGLLSVHGKKVLHLDRNNYYGGDCASLNLTQLWAKFRPGQSPPPKESFGQNRDWNVDLIPKFVMSSGTLVKLLLHTKVTRYLEWKSVDGTYVYQYQAGGFFQSEKFIHKVPANDSEAFKSPLMGLLEKNRCKNFFQFAAKWDSSNPATHAPFNPTRNSMSQVYEYFGLQPDTIDFIGHAVALHPDDTYLSQACGPTLDKIVLYMSSIARYGNSPFIYPVYGLGGLPEGFSRLSAIHGGVYMLNKPVDGFEFDDQGKVCGVKAGGEVAKAKIVICDPSYAAAMAPNKVQVTGRVIRAICVLSAPIPNTNDSTSCQIIIPQSQLRRRSDVYVMMVSWSHNVAFKDKYIAIVSTTVETSNPEKEIEPALALLGPIEHKFVTVSELFEPTDDGKSDMLFVTRSFDATSHFESAANDVLDMWTKVTNETLDLTITEDDEDQ